MTLDERVKDCAHYPRRLYIWEEPEFMPRSLHGTCTYCGTDYHVKPDTIPDLVLAPTPSDAPLPFHALLATAMKNYLVYKENK